MITAILTALIYPLALSVTAFVITNILTQPDMILDWLYNFICNDRIISTTEKKPSPFPKWLQKPLIDCPYCMAGQWALWWYLFTSDIRILSHVDLSNMITTIISIEQLNIDWSSYNPFMHVWVIIWALFGVDVLIKKLT
jgi:hypothetical protein